MRAGRADARTGTEAAHGRVDGAADAALFAALERGLAGSGVAVVRHDDLAINDPPFADAVVAALRELRDRQAASAASGKADT